MDSGLAIYRMPWWGWRGSLRRAQRPALGLAAFDRYCQDQGRPDIVHGHSLLYGGYLAAILRQQRGIPAVVTEHFSAYIRGRILPDQRPVLRETLQNLDRLVAVSKQLAASLARYGAPSTIEIVPNIVDVEFFSPTEPPPRTPFALALIAQLDANKAPDLTLRAFAQAFGAHEAHLTIAGDGPERPRLLALAAELNVQDHLVPRTPPTRTSARADPGQPCDRLSSYVETFGITLIEALACGKPVIATRSGGPDSFVTESTGLLVPTGDVPTLAAAMRQMAATYDHYDPAAIRAYCVANFSEAAFVSRIETIYTAVLAARPQVQAGSR